MRLSVPALAIGSFLVSSMAFAQSHAALTAPVPAIQGGPVAITQAATAATARTGLVQLAVKLQDPPLVVAVGANAKQNGILMTAAQQQAYLAQLKQKQDALMTAISALGGVELGRVSKGHNAVMVSVDASQIAAIKNLGGVLAVRPLRSYHVLLTNTLSDIASYIGSGAVQSSGSTGQGVRVAMIDTGIDYTHYNLGGSGNVADYTAATAAAATTPPSNLFPTAKVVGGYDFVGEVWPNGPQGENGPLTPDPNPIDIYGHGTRTADIVGGHSLDGLHYGTAPGAELYAVKVCSSVADSCPGLAILEGLDFALDPNNTGTLNDAVDVISMSLGGNFGLREEDDGEALTDIVNFGVVSVVAAGNASDVPYVLGGPSDTPEVIALAATQGIAASDLPLIINQPAAVAGTYPNTATLSFAPINAPVTGNVVYVGRGCPASGTTPADPYPAGNLSGQIFLIDRGTCNVSAKIDRAANAGAIGVLIGLVAPGDAVTFSQGGGTNFVPSLVIIQSDSTLIKNATGTVNVTLSPNNAFSLAGNIASYSSRGPNYSYNMLKPDMSAPGTVIAAEAGTGNQQSSEDGTSFATPLAAGSAALLLSKNHSLGPLDIKALLMENSDPTVYENAATEPGYLAPMSRMGAGELRVDRAAASSTGAWDASNPLAVSLSFGTYRLNTNQTFKKKVVVRNYSNATRTYSISNVYRDAPNTTGFTLSMPSSISVPANGSSSFTLTATATALSLPVWTLDGGVDGGNGELLNTVEYAGYLTFTSGSENVHLPWHILPHKAANVQPAASSLSLNGQPTTVQLSNTPGAVSGLVDVFALTGTGTQFPASSLPAPGSDYTLTNLQAVGVRLICGDATCSVANLQAQFAINTFGQRSHPDVPAEFDVFIDLNGDGIPDIDLFNEDLGTATGAPYPTGQNAVFVYDLTNANASPTAYAYSIADLDSANIIYTVPLSALTTSSKLALKYNTPFQFEVVAYDNYFTGNETDAIGPMQFELDMPQYYGAFAESTVPVNGTLPLTVIPNNAANPYFTGPYNGNSPSQTGLLLMYTDAKTGQEQSSIIVAP